MSAKRTTKPSAKRKTDKGGTARTKACPSKAASRQSAGRGKDEAALSALHGDPDTFLPDAAWWAKAKVKRPVKRLVSLRLDPDLLDWFKSQGPGYQSKINAALRAFKDHAGE